MPRARATVTGGRRVKRLARKAKAAPRVRVVEIGFLPGDTYPGTSLPVAQVAEWQEFGTATIPQRPFMRAATERLTQKDRSEVVANGVDPATLAVTVRGQGDIGRHAIAVVRREIDRWRVPPNAPSTIAKKGRDDPLRDTRLMRNRVRVRVSRYIRS